MTAIHYQKDNNNIVHLVMDKPDASANLMDAEFNHSLQQVVSQLGSDDFVGIIIRSAKKTFFAGGDLDMLYQTTAENSRALFDTTESIKRSLRAIETQGKPIVACINGAALGGGWEIALAAHYRIALEQAKIQLGLPEVTLGLLPGGGGITRMTRMLGLKEAMPYLLEGKKFNPQSAHKSGLVNELAVDENALLEQAINWIKANPQVSQPWDQKGFRLPGGTPAHPKVAQMLAIAPAMLRKKTVGVMPAPEKILAAMVEGTQVDFDTASQIETRYFIELACSPVCKNLINTFWYQLNQIKAGESRPANIEKSKLYKVGVLGAGMMGAGIAYACASKGISVVLKDISVDALENGKNYSEKLLAKKIKRGHLDCAGKDAILQNIQTTTSATDLDGCELVVEAVFEDRQLKAQVTQEAEAQLSVTSIFASNTSTLPITGLAEASERPQNFIGLHFFSPVEKMPLVEIIKGKNTSAQALARCYDFVLQIGKTPIVVNDSRGFFTSRVFATFVNEGVAMLGEGISAATIENAAFLAGFPVGPLAVTDEVSLTLIEKIKRQTAADCLAQGISVPSHPADKIIDRMLEMERAGKLHGAGFYDYDKSESAPTKNKKLWPGLQQHFYRSDAQLSLEQVKQRLLYIMAIESVRCLEEGVLNSAHDANIGSIFGIGFPSWTGGVLQFINYIGVQKFYAQATKLAENFGERFEPPALLLARSQNNERF